MIPQRVTAAVTVLGDLTLFALSAVAWTLRLPCPGTLLPCCYNVGVRSVPGEGASFWITIPISIESGAQELRGRLVLT